MTGSESAQTKTLLKLQHRHGRCPAKLFAGARRRTSVEIVPGLVTAISIAFTTVTAIVTAVRLITDIMPTTLLRND